MSESLYFGVRIVKKKKDLKYEPLFKNIKNCLNISMKYHLLYCAKIINETISHMEMKMMNDYIQDYISFVNSLTKINNATLRE